MPDEHGDDPARRALARARQRARRTAPPTGKTAPGGGEGGYSGAGADPRDPQPFGAEIDRIVAEQGWTATLPVATLMGAWDRLVGAEIAAHCRPERLTDGELVLVAESSAWATQLRLLGHQLVARLAAELGAGVVRSIRVHGPAVPDWRHGPRRVVGRGPRDTYG